MRLQQASDRLSRLGNTFYYAIALATLCELYYHREDFGKVYHTAEVARNADNGLIDYHLARIELTVGKAHIDEGKHSEAFEVLCVASDKALNFNDESFRGACSDIFNEVDRVAQQIAPEVALQLCESYIGFWENKEVALAKQGPVQESLEAIRQKQAEIEALLPIA